MLARSFLIALLVALLAVLVPAIATADGGKRANETIRVVSAPVESGVYRFSLRTRSGHRIVRAKLRVGRFQKRLNVRRVRRAARSGQVRARIAKRGRTVASVSGKHRAQLLITTAKRRAVKKVGSGASCRLGGFGAGRWPGACWRPYADSSPFNRRIPARPKLHPRSSTFVRSVTGFGKPTNLVAANGDNDWGHPTYYSTPADPVYTVHCVESWGRCSIEGHKIRIPSQARAAGAEDGHMTVVDQATGWEYDFWQVRRKRSGGGRIDISWGGRTRIDGDGLGSDATAAKFGNMAGIVRAQELAAGKIDHALLMIINCDSGEHVYPAQKSGRACSAVGRSNGSAPPMGARFQLDMSDKEIGELRVPSYKKTLLKAMADYGLYFGDTGGGSWGIQFESGATYSSFGRLDPLVAFGRAKRLPTWQGEHVFNVRDGVDWRKHLRVVDPCVARRTC